MQAQHADHAAMQTGLDSDSKVGRHGPAHSLQPGQYAQHGSSQHSGKRHTSAAATVQMVTEQREDAVTKHTSRMKLAAGLAGQHAPSPVLSVDVLLPNELLSGMLTQCSVQPELLSVMEDLFDSAGQPSSAC